MVFINWHTFGENPTPTRKRVECDVLNRTQKTPLTVEDVRRRLSVSTLDCTIRIPLSRNLYPTTSAEVRDHLIEIRKKLK